MVSQWLPHDPLMKLLSAQQILYHFDNHGSLNIQVRPVEEVVIVLVLFE